jgi:glucose-1-phosphate cytidylyltransferase
LEGEEIFLASYADGLTDLPLPRLINFFVKSGKVGCFLCVKPSQTFHVVSMKNGNLISDIRYVRDTDIMINGGYFVFRKEIFQYFKDGEDLVQGPLRRLVQSNQIVGYKYDNFWCMDTFKEHQELTDMYNSGDAPWGVWNSPEAKTGTVLMPVTEQKIA